jgi:methylamine dehydrogenase accessory protein MauD
MTQSELVAGMVFLSLVVACELLFLLALARQVGRLYMRLPPVGARALQAGPELGEAIGPVAIDDLRAVRLIVGGPHDEATLAVFTAPGCRACVELIPALRTLAGEPGLQVHVLSLSADPVENQQFQTKLADARVRVAAAQGLAKEFNITLTPYAIVLDRHGTVVGKGATSSLEHLESLIALLDRPIEELAASNG